MRLVRIFTKQFLELFRFSQLDLTQPSFILWTLVEEVSLVIQGFVDLNNSARERGVDVGGGFDGFDGTDSV